MNGTAIRDIEAGLLRDVLTRRQPIDVDALRDVLADIEDPFHIRIAQAVLDLDANGTIANPVTVAHHLNADDTDRHRIALLLEGPLGDTRAYADIITEHRRNARITLLLREAARCADTGDLTQALTHATDAVDLHTNTGDRDTHLQWVTDALEPHLELLEARAEGELVGHTTGWADLDRIIGGLRGGQLVVVAGRPAMGKSVFGAHLAVTAARHDIPTVVASVEMSVTEILDRLLAAEARIPTSHLRHGPAVNDWPRITDAVGSLAGLPLAIDDRPDATLATIRADAHRAHAGLVVVDYLQLLSATTRRDSREREVADLSGGLKRLARELDAPVVALSQLNRNIELRREKRPQLADLRESGAIEQDADVVIGLYRDEVYNPDTRDAGVIEAIVLKQRSGPLGTARLGWIAEHQRIVTLAPQGGL